MESKSIVQKDQRCYFCGKKVWLERHHIFPASNRKWSEKYGLWVWCCDFCHRDPKNGVQYNRKKADSLKRVGQMAFEETHSREEFMQIFGKNYI